MNEQQLSRYSRHIQLPQIGIDGQQRLLKARVFIVGAGGLGSPLSMYLASSGIGQLVISDFDHVELSNLQRQILHTDTDIGRDKVASARDTLRHLNPEIQINALNWALDDEELAEEIRAADVVADATDNFETRFTLNRLCVQEKTPLVSAAAVRFEGQVSVFDSRQENSPCYRCLYSDESDGGEACAKVGVLSPLLGILGSIQATEVIKLILECGNPLLGRVLVLDALSMEWRSLHLRKDPDCPVCAG